MINNQNIAVLSEKVAAIEAALKTAGIELPEVTSADNGKGLQVVNGAWATGAIIPDAVTANPETTTSDLTAVSIGSTNYIIKDSRLIYLTGTTSDSESATTIPYPTGLNNTNCTVLGFVIESSGAGSYRQGEGAFDTQFSRVMIQLNASEIVLYSSVEGLRNKTYRIVLLKI